jgi:hypothetical protein
VSEAVQVVQTTPPVQAVPLSLIVSVNALGAVLGSVVEDVQGAIQTQ